jgi:IS30 family transposase
MTAIARKIGRATSTVSRELRRNAATRSGSFEYRATTADELMISERPAEVVER